MTSKDMFLYAKLVMNNLLSQTRLSRLKKELEPGTFPRTLKQAYDMLAAILVIISDLLGQVWTNSRTPAQPRIRIP